MTNALKPLLLFPQAVRATRAKGNSGRRKLISPTGTRQKERLSSTWDSLLATQVGLSPEATFNDQFLVLELASPESEFKAACAKLGIDILGDFEEEPAQPDDDFYYAEKGERLRDEVPRRVFLWGLNYKELSRLVSFFNRWCIEGKAALPHHLKALAGLFASLRSVRFWDVEDRLRETRLLDDWNDRVAAGAEQVEVEIEIWYSEYPPVQNKRFNSVREAVENQGGILLTDLTVLADIGYSAFAAVLPISAVAEICEHPAAWLLAAESFVHRREIRALAPAGQTVFREPGGEFSLESVEAKPLPSGNPRVGLFDGVPLVGHLMLANRLLLDDPEEWSKDCPGTSRVHGTAMASVIIHGEGLAFENAISRPLYVRPVTRPTSPNGKEVMPAAPLPVALFKSAVDRMVREVPSVRVVVVSLGDSYRPFYGHMSPWARLLDHLAFRHNLLFLVSAGNCCDDIELDIDPAVASSEEIAASVLRLRLKSARNTALLSPAETVNGLTVGATHEDSHSTVSSSSLIDLLVNHPVPSHVTPITAGLRRSIKPEILAAGGRLLHKRPISTGSRTFKPLYQPQARPPGFRVASPGEGAGNLVAVRYMTGTSISNAYAGRIAHFIMDELDEIQLLNPDLPIPPESISLLVKALLVHASCWTDYEERLGSLLSDAGVGGNVRKHLSRILGYGILNPSRAIECTASRVTVIGTGIIRVDSAHRYSLPLPTSISSAEGPKRLELTTAWYSPTSFRHSHYRGLAIDQSIISDPANISKSTAEVTHYESSRGTVQSKVYQREQINTFAEGSALNVELSARSDIPRFPGSLRYAIVATLDVPNVKVDIYEAVQTKLRAQIAQAIPSR